MSLTNYGENGMLNLFRVNTTYYLALFTSTPGEGGDLTSEVSGGSYARQAVTFGTPADGIVQNSAVVEFPAATDTWGTVAYWALCDAASGGNAWWFGSITVPKTITAGDIYRIPVGSLSLSVD